MVASPAGFPIQRNSEAKNAFILKRMKSKAMIRMNDHGNFHGRSRKSAHNSRFDSVSVNDIRLQPAKHFLEMLVRFMIGRRTHRAAELTAKVYRHVHPAGL